MRLILKQEQCTLRTLQLQLLSQIMSKQHSGNEPASPRPARKELQECADLLKQVVSAKDVNMLSSRHRSLTKDFRLDNLSAYGVSWQELVLETNLLPLLVKAMLHVFDLIAEGAGTSSLLEGSTACHVAIDLSSDLHHLLQHLSDSLLPEDKVHTSLMSQWKQAAVSGASSSAAYVLSTAPGLQAGSSTACLNQHRLPSSIIGKCCLWPQLVAKLTVVRISCRFISCTDKVQSAGCHTCIGQTGSSNREAQPAAACTTEAAAATSS